MRPRQFDAAVWRARDHRRSRIHRVVIDSIRTPRTKPSLVDGRPRLSSAVDIPVPSDHRGRPSEYEAIWRSLGRSVDRGIDRFAVDDGPGNKSGHERLDGALAPAFFTDENLLLVMARMATLNMSAWELRRLRLAYGYLGMHSGPFFGDYQQGFRFGRSGSTLWKSGSSSPQAIEFIIGCFISFWVQPLNRGIGHLGRPSGGCDAGDLTMSPATAAIAWFTQTCSAREIR